MKQQKPVEYLGAEGQIPLSTFGAFPLGMDSMVLAEFASLRPGSRVYDLGCGSGTLLLLLFARQPRLTVGGVELQQSAIDLARENLTRCGLSPSFLIQEDLCRLPQLQPPGQWDLVISNPPYFAPEQGATSRDPQRSAARTGLFCTPLDVCKTAAHLLRPRGRFAFVLRPERLEEWMLSLHTAGLAPKRMRCVHHTAAHPPSMLLLEAVRQGKTGLSILPPLFAAEWNQQHAAANSIPANQQTKQQEEPL